MAYQPMTMTELAGHLARVEDEKFRWKHLAAGLDLGPPEWTRGRVLTTPWFPSSLPSKRMEALVWAPAAFRKHGVYISARDLEAA
jgi:hypothetical protein